MPTLQEIADAIDTQTPVQDAQFNKSSNNKIYNDTHSGISRADGDEADQNASYLNALSDTDAQTVLSLATKKLSGRPC